MSLQKRLAQRRAEKLYKEGGWGPQLTFPAERADGKPLVFQFRVPDGVELIEVQRLAGAAVDPPALVQRAAAL